MAGAAGHDDVVARELMISCFGDRTCDMSLVSLVAPGDENPSGIVLARLVAQGEIKRKAHSARRLLCSQGL
jgi:hypothetical protein